MSEYIGIAALFLLAGGLTAAMVFLGSTLGRKNPTPEKMGPFECGKEPSALPKGKLAIKFYLVGILFILFDVELVFLYPWAVVFRGMGLLGLVDYQLLELRSFHLVDETLYLDAGPTHLLPLPPNLS